MSDKQVDFVMRQSALLRARTGHTLESDVLCLLPDSALVQLRQRPEPTLRDLELGRLLGEAKQPRFAPMNL